MKLSMLDHDPIESAHDLILCLSMISGQTLRVCPEGKPVPTFPDHALASLAGVGSSVIGRCTSHPDLERIFRAVAIAATGLSK